MKKHFSKYMISMLILSIFLVIHGGGVSNAAAIDDYNDAQEKMKSPTQKVMDKATGKDKVDKKLEEKTKDAAAKNDPEYKEDRKEHDTKKAKNRSYAKILFDDEKKNQTLMYYDKQTGTKAKTVEAKIKKKTHNEAEAKKYATFLYSLNAWNLYNVQSTQQDAITFWLIAIIKGIYGSLLLACFHILSGLEAIKNIFANLMDQLNVWKYITDESGSIPKDSPVYFLNPVIDVYHSINRFAKVILAIFMAWVAFRLVTGVGKARMRGNYFKNKGLTLLYATLAMVLAATFASMALSVGTDMLKESEGKSTSAIEKIPKSMIIDTNQYIDNSLTKIKDKKGAEGTNDGYVLNHDNENFPTTANDVNTKIPNKKLVEYMNTGGDKSKEDNIDGRELLHNWAYSVSLNSNDINTMYNLSQKASEKNNYNFMAFKLAPQEQGVKLTGGKEFFGTELKNAQVASGSLAGNSGMGVGLNAIKMGAIIMVVTFVIVILYLSIFTGFMNAIKDFLVNVSFSQMGLYQAFFGIFVTATILLLSIQLTLFLIDIYPDMVLSLDESFTDQLNNDTKFDGTVKQTLQTLLSVLVLWFATKIVWKIRKGVMMFVSEWFSKILDGMNPNGALAGGHRADKQSLENALNSNLFGHEFAEGVSDNPYDAAKSGITKGMQTLKDLQSKDNKEEQSVLDAMNNEESNGVNSEKTAEFSGRASSKQDDEDGQSDSQDIENIQEDINEGLQSLEDTSDEGIAKNFDDQNQSIDRATNEFEKLNDSQQELQSARDNLEALKKADAPQEDILAAEQRVNEAEEAYNEQLGKSQEASRLLARSGAGIEDIGTSKAQAMRDYHDASNEIESAEQKVEDLTNEREEMEAFGASEAQKQSLDTKIGQAKDELAVSRAKQQLAQKAYESNVINTPAEKEARSNLLDAQEGHIKAERSLEQASKNGNLNNEDYKDLQTAATSLDSEVQSMQQQIDQQVENGVIKQDAIKHMQQNGGTAFTNSDLEVQEKELQTAANRVENIQQEYNDMAASTNTDEYRLNNLKQELSNAQSMHTNLQTANQAIHSGKNIGSAIKTQQQVLSQTYENKVHAEKVLSELDAQEKAGVVTDRQEMKDAVSRVQQANVAYSNAGRVLSGLKAVKNVGHSQMSEAQLQTLHENTQSEVNDLYTTQQNISNVGNTISKLKNGGQADIRETHALSQFQKKARRQASEKVKNAHQRYNDLQQKIAKLKRLEQNGVHVQTQVNRYENSLKHTKKELDDARKHESFISSQGFTINSVGKTMQKNYIDAKENVKTMADEVNQHKQKHEDILKTGGLSKDQLERYKQQLQSEQEHSQNNKEQFLKDRESKIDTIKKEFESK